MKQVCCGRASGEAVVTTSKLCRVTVNATVLQVFKRSSVDLCTQCSPDRFEILNVSFALLETWRECCGRLVIFRVTLRAWLPMPSHNTGGTATAVYVVCISKIG